MTEDWPGKDSSWSLDDITIHSIRTLISLIFLERNSSRGADYTKKRVCVEKKFAFKVTYVWYIQNIF